LWWGGQFNDADHESSGRENGRYHAYEWIYEEERNLVTTNSVSQQESKRTLKSYFPILEWLPNYDKGWLRGDVIAALTLWALLVPEAMAYAGIAGMPPETGLYAAPLALIAYAIFGTSKQLDVGPSSAVAALSLRNENLITYRTTPNKLTIR